MMCAYFIIMAVTKPYPRCSVDPSVLKHVCLSELLALYTIHTFNDQRRPMLSQHSTYCRPGWRECRE